MLLKKISALAEAFLLGTPTVFPLGTISLWILWWAEAHLQGSECFANCIHLTWLSQIFPERQLEFSFYWQGSRDSEGESPWPGTWNQTFQGQHHFHYLHTSFEWLCYHDCLKSHHLLNTYYVLSGYCHIYSITTWHPIDISNVTSPEEKTWFCIPTPGPPSVFLT